MVENVIIWILSLLSIGSALSVILQKNPVISALSLICTFFGLAGLFVTLEAPFIAAIQILVYAGAITVLFVFVIMLLNLRRDPERFTMSKVSSFPRIILLVLFFLFLYTVISITAFPVGIPDLKSAYSVRELAELLFSRYLFPFELISFLLLVAMIGGVVMAKKPTKGSPK